MANSNSNVETFTLLSAKTSTGVGDSTTGRAGEKTYHASGATTAGTGAATIKVEGSMNGTAWDTLGTITLTLGTTAVSDGFGSFDRYALVRGNLTAISGTGAAVTLVMGC